MSKIRRLLHSEEFMDLTKIKTMKEVVSQLREGASEALFELFELHVAVGELVLNAQVLSAVAKELATESGQIADRPELALSERLRDLAKAATKTSEVIDGQTRALGELQRGLDAWNIAGTGLRLV